MNIIQHVVLAFAIQSVVASLCRNWFAGAAASAAWAISREITQAEYRWIEAFGHGLRANMPWWGGLDPAVWQKADPWIDWMIPTAVTFALAFALQAGRPRKDPVDDLRLREDM